MTLTEFELADNVKHARQQDLFALGELHDAYYPKLYRYLSFRLFDDQLSQELTDEVFTLLLSSWQKTGKEPADLEAWLYSTAADLVDETNLESTRKVKGTLQDDPKRLDPPPPTDAEAVWLGNLVRKALLDLTPEQQHILALRFSGHYSLTDIARLTSRGLPDIRALQFSSLVLVRQSLERDADAE